MKSILRIRSIFPHEPHSLRRQHAAKYRSPRERYFGSADDWSHLSLHCLDSSDSRSSPSTGLGPSRAPFRTKNRIRTIFPSSSGHRRLSEDALVREKYTSDPKHNFPRPNHVGSRCDQSSADQKSFPREPHSLRRLPAARSRSLRERYFGSEVSFSAANRRARRTNRCRSKRHDDSSPTARSFERAFEFELRFGLERGDRLRLG